MSADVNPRTELRKLLLDLFREQELKTFVLDYYDSVHVAVSGDRETSTRELVIALANRGFITHRLFDKLVVERPARAKEIKRVRELFIGLKEGYRHPQRVPTYAGAALLILGIVLGAVLWSFMHPSQADVLTPPTLQTASTPPPKPSPSLQKFIIDELFKQVHSTDPDTAFTAIARLIELGADKDKLSVQLKQKLEPERFDHVLLSLLVAQPQEPSPQRDGIARNWLLDVMAKGESVQRSGAAIAAAELLRSENHAKRSQEVLNGQRLKLYELLGEPPTYPELPWKPVAGGRFKMGCVREGCESNEGPTHTVTIKDFQILKTEVTIGLVRRFVEEAQPEWKKTFRDVISGVEQGDGLDRPLRGVNWYEATAIAFWLGGRLPTEAEWEYAARGGRKSFYWTGDDIESLKGWEWVVETSPVDQCRPPPQDVCSAPSVIQAQQGKQHPFGLCDMHGNVYEWVADWFGLYRDVPVYDPPKPGSPRSRVLRGGSLITPAQRSRLTSRESANPFNRAQYVGFRVVRDAS